MWKSLDEITAHNQQMGRGGKYDPFESLTSFVARVEGVMLEGDEVVLISCCESARLKKSDVLEWREVGASPGNATLYDVRVRKGAAVLAQRAAFATREEQKCERCGRGWNGLPPAGGDGHEHRHGHHDHDHDRGHHDHDHDHDHDHHDHDHHDHDHHDHGHGHGHDHHDQGHGHEHARGCGHDHDHGHEHGRGCGHEGHGHGGGERDFEGRRNPDEWRFRPGNR